MSLFDRFKSKPLNLCNKRGRNESFKKYKERQKLMAIYCNESYRARFIKKMPPSMRHALVKSMKKGHHNPDTHYGSLSAHKKWAARRCNKLAKINLVEKGMKRLFNAYGVTGP